jgi:dimethylamine--corrinoid protein Co-methyltransferase
MGLYFQPDGPYPNPAELLPEGKIGQALEAQEIALEHLFADLVTIGKEMNAVGCEGLNFDTAASAGDADFKATLVAVEKLKALAPDMAIEVGMSSEFVMGMHGDITYKGTRLAGIYPHEQVKVAEAAGADIFGPAINVNTSESIPWNLSRAVTFVKATVAVADIPVHPNVGMGVCGVPMFEVPPVDAVTRASTSLVQIGKADGL